MILYISVSQPVGHGPQGLISPTYVHSFLPDFFACVLARPFLLEKLSYLKMTDLRPSYIENPCSTYSTSCQILVKLVTAKCVALLATFYEE